jgi:putative flavoprotein involved in K+ transport
MIDCVVVGGGPAGLATSVELTRREVVHVVLDAGRAGQSWRTQRWASFRLNTPGWTTRLLGEQARDAYLSGGEVVQRLTELAHTVPIREGVRVTGLTAAGTGYTLRTSDGEIRARTVVIATGDENIPRLPELAATVPGQVAQLHAADYRTPGALPDGVVLVVGSGQSGCQISEDLLTGGRQVLLATSPVGRVPLRHRGHGSVELLHAAGFFDQTPADLPDPAMMRAPQPILAPGGRPLSLQTLARSGATLAGRLVGVDEGRVRFDDSAAANVAAGDAFVTRIRAMLDELIARTGQPPAPAVPDDVDQQPVELHPPPMVELAKIGTVLWCTGVTGDFSWLDPALRDTAGRPRHTGCAGARPGLWYVGLRWLTHRSSATLAGIPKDAATVATALTAHLDATRTAETSRPPCSDRDA